MAGIDSPKMMKENHKQFRIGRFGITIFYDNQITFFSIVEQIDDQKSKMLMWKFGEGFSADEILTDTNSDLETTRTIDASQFSRKQVLALLDLQSEALEEALCAQFIEILSRKV